MWHNEVLEPNLVRLTRGYLSLSATLKPTINKLELKYEKRQIAPRKNPVSLQKDKSAKRKENPHDTLKSQSTFTYSKARNKNIKMTSLFQSQFKGR